MHLNYLKKVNEQICTRERMMNKLSVHINLIVESDHFLDIEGKASY